MYRGIWHGRPIVNGYSGNFPSWYMSLRLGLEGHDPSLLDELAALGVTQVVLDSSLDPGGGWDRYVRTRASRMDSGERTGFAVYRLTGTAKSQSGQNLALGSPLPFRAIELSVNPNQVPALTDGDLQTRWETGPQTGAEEMVIDLGASQRVGAVVLSLGQFGADFPRDLQVEVSEDGQTWTEAWRGTCAGPAFVAAVRDPKSVPLTIALGNAPARFIRLRQLAKEPTFYWSVAELSVRGPA
jgi:hypothetical protein